MLSSTAPWLPPAGPSTPRSRYTTPGGELVILDTAGYGPMTIDKSIKVIGPSGVYGGISVLGGLGPPPPPSRES